SLPSKLSGASHTCVIFSNTDLKCVGLNANGQLGYSDTTTRGDSSASIGDNLAAVDLGTGLYATAVAAGTSHTCVILQTAAVKCWGLNSAAQLGLGDTTNRGSSSSTSVSSLPAVDLGTGVTATAVSAGDSHTCVITNSAALRCWGYNNRGQTGYGSTSSPYLYIGDSSSEMGSGLTSVSLGTGRTATKVWCGSSFTCVLLDDATTKCFGEGTRYQLGTGSATTISTSSQMGDSLAAISLDFTAAAAGAAGQYFACVLSSAGVLKCFGVNTSGQLGQDSTSSSGTATGSGLAATYLGGSVTATSVCAGANHACAILSTGGMKCWGLASKGQLGYGDTNTRGAASGTYSMASLAALSIPAGLTVTAIASSHAATHTCAIFSDGTLRCWGNNSSGQLCQGSTSTYGDGAGETLDVLAAADFGS
ncbi:unnamed protein product, partial [Phaeothamnion confervicola]